MSSKSSTLDEKLTLVLLYYERKVKMKYLPLPLKKLIIRFYGHYIVEWSKQYKSKDIRVFEGTNPDVSSCELLKRARRSIRCKYPLPKLVNTKWEIDCQNFKNRDHNFFGIITAHEDNEYESLAYWECFKICYGLDTSDTIFISNVIVYGDSKYELLRKKIIPIRIKRDISTAVELEYAPKIGKLFIRQNFKECALDISTEHREMEFYPAFSFHCAGVGAKIVMRLLS